VIDFLHGKHVNITTDNASKLKRIGTDLEISGLIDHVDTFLEHFWERSKKFDMEMELIKHNASLQKRLISLTRENCSEFYIQLLESPCMRSEE
jgi:hypothetical protein